MQVSGDLFRLPADAGIVPLPWFCRAPLGLKSGTSVHVALVESGEAGRTRTAPPPADHTGLVEFCRPPDLLISVLDPQAWQATCRLDSYGPDGPGLLHRVLDAIAEANKGEMHINVVIGESFTVPATNCADRRMRHHKTTLYCQFQQGEASRQRFEAMMTSLRSQRDFAEQTIGVDTAPHAAGHVAMYLGTAVIKSGLVRLPHDWRQISEDLYFKGLAERLSDREAARRHADAFDYNVVCALADLDARAIRLTFPVKGARRLQTRHTDRPNTVVRVTERLGSV